MEPLQRLLQHRPVVLLHEPGRDLDRMVGPDPHEVPVVGCVVQAAHGEPIGDLGPPSNIAVPEDVGSIKQLRPRQEGIGEVGTARLANAGRTPLHEVERIKSRLPSGPT
jgi:hypothetical protein